MDAGLRRDLGVELTPWRAFARSELLAGFGRLVLMPARDARHVLEKLMKRLVGGVGHLGEGAQETVGARQLEQRFLAVLRCRGGDQHRSEERRVGEGGGAR